jgi:hypothetical protein
MKVIRRKDLNIEDIRSEDYWNRLRIFSILNNENSDTKLFNHSLVKKCLSTRDSVLSIIKSFKYNQDNNRDYNQYREFNLNLRTHIIENLPYLTHLKISNEFSNSLVTMRDMKYIDIDTTYFVRIPKEIAENREIRKQYENIQLKSIKNYREFISDKNREKRKYAKHFLPSGIQNRVVLSLNTEENIELINNLICSDMVLDNQLGDILERVFNTEIKIKPDCTKRNIENRVVQYLLDLVSEKQSFKQETFQEFNFKYVDDIVENIITNFEQIINPLGSKEELEFDYNDQVNIGKLFSKINLGNIAKSKGSVLSGFLSFNNIAVLLENNFQLHVPIFSDLVDIDKELDRPNKYCFTLPIELENRKDIKNEMQRKISEIYVEIKKWRDRSKGYMSEEMSKEFTKYLLPISHTTRFNIYLDINDIFHLREIEFEYKDHWNKLFYQKDPLFKKI